MQSIITSSSKVICILIAVLRLLDFIIAEDSLSTKLSQRIANDHSGDEITNNHRIRKDTILGSPSVASSMAPTAAILEYIITTVPGSGISGYKNGLINSTNAIRYHPKGIATDGSGNIYIVDPDKYCIRKVTVSTGNITTVAGTGAYGYNGDGIAATKSNLDSMTGVAVDGSGNIYIVDTGNQRIRKVTVSTGIITTIAGTGVAGDDGDGIAATRARVRTPYGVAVDGSGNIYIADTGNQRIRKVTVSTGIITAVAGTGAYGYNGDGIAATSADLQLPMGVAVDGSGNIYIADTGNQRIRKVTVSTGIITTIAGTGVFGYNGDGIAATSADLQLPIGVAVDRSGNIYIADVNNSRVRKITVSTGIITTLAGTGSYGYSSDGINAITAAVYDLFGIAVDGSDNVYFTDYDRVKKLTIVASPSAAPSIKRTPSCKKSVKPTPSPSRYPTRKPSRKCNTKPPRPSCGHEREKN
jgi:trimeric autotransporter adhesin